MSTFVTCIETEQGLAKITLEDFEIENMIFSALQSIRNVTSQDITIAVNLELLNFLIAAGTQIISVHYDHGRTKYKIFGHDVIVTSDCFLKVMIDPMNDLIV